MTNGVAVLPFSQAFGAEQFPPFRARVPRAPPSACRASNGMGPRGAVQESACRDQETTAKLFRLRSSNPARPRSRHDGGLFRRFLFLANPANNFELCICFAVMGQALNSVWWWGEWCTKPTKWVSEAIDAEMMSRSFRLKYEGMSLPVYSVHTQGYVVFDRSRRRSHI